MKYVPVGYRHQYQKIQSQNDKLSYCRAYLVKYYKIRPNTRAFHERKVSIWFTVHYSRFRIQRLVQYSRYYSEYDLQRLVLNSAYYSKVSRVLFSVWFTIQGIIQNTTCSVWFRIQRIIKKCPGYYSAYGSVFRVLFRIQPAASGSGFSVLLKMSRVLFSVRFSIQGIIQNTTSSVWFRIQDIIKKCPGYYSASGSVFRVLFNIRPAASGSEFSVLLKNVQGIIQRLVQYSGYYSKYDLQRLVQDSAYY